MSVIRQGLERHLDISKFLDPRFTYDQMYEIYVGLKSNIDVSKYADPSIPAEQMREIRLKLT